MLDQMMKSKVSSRQNIIDAYISTSNFDRIFLAVVCRKVSNGQKLLELYAFGFTTRKQRKIDLRRISRTSYEDLSYQLGQDGHFIDVKMPKISAIKINDEKAPFDTIEYTKLEVSDNSDVTTEKFHHFTPKPDHFSISNVDTENVIRCLTVDYVYDILESRRKFTEIFHVGTSATELFHHLLGGLENFREHLQLQINTLPLHVKSSAETPVEIISRAFHDVTVTPLLETGKIMEKYGTPITYKIVRQFRNEITELKHQISSFHTLQTESEKYHVVELTWKPELNNFEAKSQIFDNFHIKTTESLSEHLLKSNMWDMKNIFIQELKHSFRDESMIDIDSLAAHLHSKFTNHGSDDENVNFALGIVDQKSKRLKNIQKIIRGKSEKPKNIVDKFQKKKYVKKDKNKPVYMFQLHNKDKSIIIALSEHEIDRKKLNLFFQDNLEKLDIKNKLITCLISSRKSKLIFSDLQNLKTLNIDVGKFKPIDQTSINTLYRHFKSRFSRYIPYRVQLFNAKLSSGILDYSSAKITYIDRLIQRLVLIADHHLRIHNNHQLIHMIRAAYSNFYPIKVNTIDSSLIGINIPNSEDSSKINIVWRWRKIDFITPDERNYKLTNERKAELLLDSSNLGIHDHERLIFFRNHQDMIEIVTCSEKYSFL